MAEPEFIRQCSDPMTEEDRRSWLEARVQEARGFGAALCRVSVHTEIPDLILFEGWKEQPDEQGEPRFQLTAEVQR